MKKGLNREWDQKLRDAVERAKEREQKEAEKVLNQAKKDFEDDFKILKA